MTLAIGDSLTAKRTAWPTYLQQQGKWYKTMAQSIRFATNYDLPSDLLKVDDHEIAVYWLGTNDSLFYNDNENFQQKYKDKFQEHMMRLLQTGFKVLIVPPPSLPGTSVDTSGIRAHQIFWHAIAVALNNNNVRLIDPDNYGYAEGVSEDKIHPSDEWSEYWSGIIDSEVESWLAEIDSA